VNSQSGTLGNHSLNAECVKLGQVPNLPSGDYSVVADWRSLVGGGNDPGQGAFFWVAQDDKLNVNACINLIYTPGTYFECKPATIR
jgi:hypothetical protein